MFLEDYFDFLTENDIRIKGSRIGIETILYDFIHRGQNPQEIWQSYPQLSLEQIYATILYYLHNKKQIDQYISNWLDEYHQRLQAQKENPHEGIIRLRQCVQQQGRDIESYLNFHADGVSTSKRKNQPESSAYSSALS